MNATLEDAIIIAAQAHRGQKDKKGVTYILHPLRLMLRMQSEVEMMVAVLHDALEDTDLTIDQLQDKDFPQEVLKAVECLTRKDNESYDKFIERVRTNPTALRVKVADLEDNMDIKRIIAVTSRDLERLEKYHKAWSLLTKDLES